MDDCTSTAPATQALLGLRVGGAFAILAASSLGVLLPFWAATARLQALPAVWLLRTMAAGVVLATGFVHVLADAATTLGDPCLGLGSGYPWPMALALASVLAIFSLEFCLGKAFGWRAARLAQQAAVHEQADLEASELQAEKLRTRPQYATASMSFEFGIIFHSIFIGISFGVASDPGTVHALSVALCFHQFFEGLALGSTFVKAEYGCARYALLAAAFVFVTPAGVAIGLGVGARYAPESKLALGFEGAFDSLSAGILIYNAIADLILPAFSEAEMPRQLWLQGMGIATLFAGAGVMALIGIWA